MVEGSDLRSGVTGPAAQSLDSQESSEQALVVVSVVTLLLIVVLLALIFRSVIACALPIVTVALVGTSANGLIAVANEAFDLKADSSISVILFIVLFGIGTDYILFFLFRYREALRLGFGGRDAVSHAVERAGEAIASAGAAVIIAFMAMVLSSLSIFRSIGPALAIAVAYGRARGPDTGARCRRSRGATGHLLAVEEVDRRARGHSVPRHRAGRSPRTRSAMQSPRRDRSPSCRCSHSGSTRRSTSPTAAPRARSRARP